MSLTQAEITDVHERYIEVTLDVTSNLDDTLTPIVRDCGKECTIAAIDRTCRKGKPAIWKDLHIAALKAKLAGVRQPPIHDTPSLTPEPFNAPTGWRAGIIKIIMAYTEHGDTIRYCDELEAHHRQHDTLTPEIKRDLDQTRQRARENQENGRRPGLRPRDMVRSGRPGQAAS